MRSTYVSFFTSFFTCLILRSTCLVLCNASMKTLAGGEMSYAHIRSTLERSQPIVVALLDQHLVTVIIRIINILLILILININYYHYYYYYNYYYYYYYSIIMNSICNISLLNIYNND